VALGWAGTAHRAAGARRRLWQRTHTACRAPDASGESGSPAHARLAVMRG